MDNEKILTFNMIWQSVPLGRDYSRFEQDLKNRWKPGECMNALYAFEGRHDAHPFDTTLYIGMTEMQGVHRALQSAQQRFFTIDSPSKMYGSYRDVILRWAIIDSSDSGITKALESLFIIAMKPPLNSKEVDVWLPESAWNLIVSNREDKGVLLPMLHGDYFTHL